MANPGRSKKTDNLTKRNQPKDKSNLPPEVKKPGESEGDRDSNGRFVKGNKAAQCPRIRFRARMVSKISDEDFDQSVSALLAECKKGNVKAIELLLRYIMPDSDSMTKEIEGLKYDTLKDISDSMSKVAQEFSEGNITIDSAKNLLDMLKAKADINSVQFEKQLEQAEKNLADLKENMPRKK